MFRTALAVALLAATSAFAQHQGHAMPAPAASPSTREFQDSAARMHRDMAIAYSGNADRDFAAGMIPHHQAAIDMARIQLRYGTAPEMRAMAEDIIRTQEAEIARLRAFLAR